MAKPCEKINAAYIICQTLASWLSSPCGSVFETELFKWQTSSTILPFFRFTNPPAPFDSPVLGQDPFYFTAPASQPVNALQPITSSSTDRSTAIHLQRHQLHPLQETLSPSYIYIARINTREVIKSASSPSIFESCALW